MKILISIEHPAWAHQFHYVIKELEKKKHNIKVVAINKDVTLHLLDAFDISYEIVSDTAGNNFVEKILIFFSALIKMFIISLKFQPDIFFGRASPMLSVLSFILRKPHILFEDTEHSTICLTLSKMFSTIIFTPIYFKLNLGKKHVRIHAFKELFYLHPNWFDPQVNVLNNLGFDPYEKYVIVRFVTWTSHHDYKQSGVTDKYALIEQLEPYARIFITSEVPLDEGLRKYQLRIPPEHFHHVLYFAFMYIGEGGTTATESALLGTPSIHISTKAKRLGNFDELNKYGLISIFNNLEEAQADINKIISNDLNKLDMLQLRDSILKTKIDVTKFFIWFLHHYPSSIKKLHTRKEIL